MKRLLPLALLTGPALVQAQTPATPSPATHPAFPYQLANPHYLELREPTPVYHQPADTAGNRYAFKLLPGTRAYITGRTEDGYFLRLTDDEGRPYYLPRKYVAGIRVQIEL